MTNHDDMPTRFPALVWAVIFTILLAGRSGGDIRTCPDSLGRHESQPTAPSAAEVAALLGHHARGVVSFP